MDPTVAAVLQLHNVSLQLGQRTVLEQVSCSVTTGRTLGIVGPNGAGKSSLLRLLYGEIQASQGQVLFHNKVINTYRRAELARQMAVVMQSPVPVFNLTTEQMVMLGLVPHKRWFDPTTSQDHHQLQLALEKTGLLALRSKKLAELSGGELQRAFIARALVQNAKVLLLDEPTNHLDVHYQHQILQLIRQLNLTIVCCLHDLNLAASYCDDILLLDQGRVQAFGPAEQVLTPKRLTRVFQQPCLLLAHDELARPVIHFYPKLRGDGHD
ncbi:iron complex transport system ATP-binding protein [Alkalimonas amylolytica]|uniref:Iron complex transport system ATP-binding protein n=1 Tax=Alkalimonas amylolytica TaxID=152573 RepID=A0A1H4FZ62_ALKAM|nr:iron complex transport system ATP-binding protein [Alkalimonas amylolytica]